MKNFENRLLKLEEITQQLRYDKDKCYAFVIKRKQIDDSLIIQAIRLLFDRAVTKKEVKKCKRFRDNNGHWNIVSPNFTIEKLITQNR